MYKIIGADQREYGPVAIDQVRQWIVEGRANGQTLAQAEGSAEWKPLASFPELADLLAAAPKPFVTPATPATAPLQSDLAPRLRGPGIALLIVGILIILGSIGDLVMSLRATQPITFPGNPQVEQFLNSFQKSLSGPMATFWALVHTAVGALITVAGIRLRQARSYSLVMTAAVLAMIPCTSGCCCLLGLPIGIWVLMTIKEPSVKAVFK